MLDIPRRIGPEPRRLRATVFVGLLEAAAFGFNVGMLVWHAMTGHPAYAAIAGGAAAFMLSLLLGRIILSIDHQTEMARLGAWRTRP